MKITLPILLSILLVSTLAPLSPHAFANPSCGDTITTSTTLTGDISGCTFQGLVIGADDIVLDCARHTITGTGSGVESGILLYSVTGVTVKNCNVTGFLIGINIFGSSNNNLVRNTSNSNIGTGFVLQGTATGNVLKGNTAMSNSDTGFFLQGTATGNILTGNTANSNSGYGYEDGTTGSGTAGTDNTYSHDHCKGNDFGASHPSGLCKTQS